MEERIAPNSTSESSLTPPSEGQPIAGKHVLELVKAPNLKNILVPIDFSRISEKALDYAVPLARQFGAKITLLHAIEPLPYTVGLIYGPMGVGLSTGPVRKELDKLARRLIEPQLIKDVLVQLGTAFQVIAKAARDCEADLIVITTHGHTGLKHVFIGSTAERIVRHAPCPVLIVRASEHTLARGGRRKEIERP